MTTTHYGFKLFESADKPSWLENWNQTMTDIDQALYNISTGGGDLPDLTEVVQRIQALEGRMTSAELRLNEDEGAISDLQDTVEELSGLASRLSTLESTVANNTSRISTLETDLGTVKNTDIPTLQTGISQAQAQNTTQDQQISGLDGRVTALENAGGGGVTVTKIEENTAYSVSTISFQNSLDTLFSTYDIDFLVIVSNWYKNSPTSTVQSVFHVDQSDANLIMSGRYFKSAQLQYSGGASNVTTTELYFNRVTTSNTGANFSSAKVTIYGVKI